MSYLYKVAVFILVVGVSMPMVGCATFETISASQQDSPKVYSGTRVDIHAMAKDKRYLESLQSKYGIRSPEHPGVDLPFSFLLDSVLFPLTSSYALYEVLFD